MIILRMTDDMKTVLEGRCSEGCDPHGGILMIPDSLELPVQRTEAEEAEATDKFVQALIEIMSKPLKTIRMFSEQAGERACYCDESIGCHVHVGDE